MAQAQTNTDKVGKYYRMLDDRAQDQMYRVKEAGQDLIDIIDGVGDSAELERAKARVEEAVMWAVKHIANA